jgi:transposase
MRGVFEALAEDLRIRGRLDVREAFIDESFAPAKKGDRKSEKQNAVREAGSWRSQSVKASPLQCALKVRLRMSETGCPHSRPNGCARGTTELIGDNAYDSDKLETELRLYGIELIAPHRSNRRNRTQDLRRMRRYRRRWKIESLFAWLQIFRRLLVHYERYAENFLGFFTLAAA